MIAVEKNGTVCISILHEPGDDQYGYEDAGERWLPIHTVETIMISVISMLATPNADSPANVEAGVSLPPFIFYCNLFIFDSVRYVISLRSSAETKWKAR